MHRHGYIPDTRHPFLDDFRTLCLTPTAEIQTLLVNLQQLPHA